MSARAHVHPHLRISGSECPIVLKCLARDPIVTKFTRVGGGVTTFARACSVSLSRKPLSAGIKATPKTDLSLSRSLVHRQTWRLTGRYTRLTPTRTTQGPELLTVCTVQCAVSSTYS